MQSLSTQHRPSLGAHASRWQQRWQRVCRLLTGYSSLTTFAEPFIRWVRPHFVAGFTQARIIQIQPLPQGFLLRLKCASTIDFVPGQHIQLRILRDGRFIDRVFTICSTPGQARRERVIELAIREKANGSVSSWLKNGVCPGQAVWLGEVTGAFVWHGQKPALMVAAGSGITPFRAMLQSMSRLTHPVRLIYIVPKQQHVWFADEWLALQAKYPLLEVQIHDTQQRGRPSAAWLIEQAREHQADLYICGPASLHQSLHEAWPTSLATCLYAESFGLQSSGGVHQVHYQTMSGVNHKVEASGSLLQLAEQAGLTVKYGCRRGVCMQCLCEKQQGQVRNLVTGELSTFGTEAIQLCISEAVSDVTLRLPS